MSDRLKSVLNWLREGRRQPTGLSAMPAEKRDRCVRANARLHKYVAQARGTKRPV